MTNDLDVLLVEGRPRAGEGAARSLTEAGHRVHRCYDSESRGFPCRGVTDPDACPLDGGIDVVLVVRHGVTPRAMPLEQGVGCAIRAGLPIVEDGPESLDPFEPWLVGRVDGDDHVAACEAAVGQGTEELVEAVVARVDRVVAAAGIDPAGVRCTVEPRGHHLRVGVEIDGPTDRMLEQVIAVRVLDALRGGRRTYGQVDVNVIGTSPAASNG
jgi:hypothetical protein